MLSLLIPSILKMSASKALLGAEAPGGSYICRAARRVYYRHRHWLPIALRKVPPRCAFAATCTDILCYDSRMRGLADIHLDVRGGDIIVDLPGTRYTVTYHKPAVSPQLLAAYLPGQNDPRTELTQAEFLARAWRLANEKARELDWIV
jgi:hypothetical protein